MNKANWNIASRRGAATAALFLILPLSGIQAAGTEAAAFLEIPVGAEPAAMGGAYGAQATNAYAMVYNPAGLGFSESPELAGQHLSYLESIHYEFASYIHPLKPGKVIGASLQYLGSGDITQTNAAGDNVGEFSSYYAAYTLAYGQKLTEKISLGIAGKWINAGISHINANAYAVDGGIMVRATNKLTLAGSMSNAGTKLTFIDEGGSLPLLGRFSATYQAKPQLKLATDVVYRGYGLASGHFGAEWRPMRMFAIRAGYRTDTTKELGAAAGVSAGMGLNLWGQEFSYAWVPYGDLGTTNYISMLLRFGEKAESQRNLIHYERIKIHRTAQKETSTDIEYEQLMQLLNDDSLNLASTQITAQ